MSRNVKRENSWQAVKSENTRTAIMEATISCYIKYGYTNTTVTNIAEEAGFSRGAMMHHFEDRQDIISASIRYLSERRLNEYRELLEKSSLDQDHGVNLENMRITMNALWKYFHTPSFIAFQELLVASRCDKELAKLMDPEQKKLDRRITESIRSMFPAWEEIEETREVVTDLLFYTLQGMAMNNVTNRNQARVKNLLDMLVNQTLELYQQAIESKPQSKPKIAI